MSRKPLNAAKLSFHLDNNAKLDEKRFNHCKTALTGAKCSVLISEKKQHLRKFLGLENPIFQHLSQSRKTHHLTRGHIKGRYEVFKAR